MNIMRRLCQWGAIAIILLLPLISRGGALYQAFGPGATHVKSLATPWEYFLYKSYAFSFGRFDDPVALSDQFNGGYWSITLFGVTISDPLALLGHALAGLTIHWPLLVGALMPIIIAVLMGRVFCGWICPVNTILELNAKFRRWLERKLIHIRLPTALAPLQSRYLVLLAGIIISTIAGVGIFGFILPYVGLVRDWHLVVYGGAFGFGVLFMVVLMAIELVAAPRLWCRSLCPTGLVLGLLGRKRLFGIKPHPSRDCLQGCHLCAKVCPVGVDPINQLKTEECMMCNACVTQCPSDVITLGLTTGQAKRHSHSVTALSIAFALVFLAGSSFEAKSHHIKGLPHYGYLENYPQTPTFELQATIAPYDIIVVTYLLEGLDKSLAATPDDAMSYVTITNKETRKPYTGRLEIEFQPKNGSSATTRFFLEPLEETVYRSRVTLSANSYDMTLRILDEPQRQVTIHLDLSPGSNWWLIASALAAIGALSTVILLGVNRRHRPARPRTQ